MIFLNSLGKQVTLTPTLAKEDLDKETVQKLMTDISDLGIFEKDDVKLYSHQKRQNTSKRLQQRFSNQFLRIKETEASRGV